MLCLSDLKSSKPGMRTSCVTFLGRPFVHLDELEFRSRCRKVIGASRSWIYIGSSYSYYGTRPFLGESSQTDCLRRACTQKIADHQKCSIHSIPNPHTTTTKPTPPTYPKTNNKKPDGPPKKNERANRKPMPITQPQQTHQHQITQKPTLTTHTAPHPPIPTHFVKPRRGETYGDKAMNTKTNADGRNSGKEAWSRRECRGKVGKESEDEIGGNVGVVRFVGTKEDEV